MPTGRKQVTKGCVVQIAIKVAIKTFSEIIHQILQNVSRIFVGNTQCSNQVFETELERLRNSIGDQEVAAKLDGLKDLDWSGYIARELRKAGFRGEELDEFVHEIVVKLLVSPGKVFTGWNPRHHGPLDRRFGASVRNQISNIVSKRANRRRYLPSVSIGSDGEGVPEDFLPAAWDDHTVADFRDLLAHRLGPLAVALFDAKMRGEDIVSLVGDPKLGSPTMYKLKSMMRAMKSLG